MRTQPLYFPLSTKRHLIWRWKLFHWAPSNLNSSESNSPKQSSREGTAFLVINWDQSESKSGRSFIRNWSVLVFTDHSIRNWRLLDISVLSSSHIGETWVELFNRQLALRINSHLLFKLKPAYWIIKCRFFSCNPALPLKYCKAAGSVKYETPWRVMINQDVILALRVEHCYWSRF